MRFLKIVLKVTCLMEVLWSRAALFKVSIKYAITKIINWFMGMPVNKANANFLLLSKIISIKQILRNYIKNFQFVVYLKALIVIINEKFNTPMIGGYWFRFKLITWGTEPFTRKTALILYQNIPIAWIWSFITLSKSCKSSKFCYVMQYWYEKNNYHYDLILWLYRKTLLINFNFN